MSIANRGAPKGPVTASSTTVTSTTSTQSAVPEDVVDIVDPTKVTPERAIIASNPKDGYDGITDHIAVLGPQPKRHAVVDSEYVPKSHIINNLEGDPWTVYYYRQILGSNDEAQPLMIGTAAAHQQYELIQRFVLKVMQPVDTSQDTSTKAFTLIGSAGVFFGLIPNFGDMFIADVGDGIAGLFTVTSSERMAATKEASYLISYQLVAHLDDVRKKELDAKTIRELVFTPELIELLDNPFMTVADHNTFVTINDLDIELREHYVRRFWSREASTYCVPQQETLTYDGWLSNFLMEIGIAGDGTREAKLYANGPLDTRDILTFWDCILDMTDRELPYVERTLGPTSVMHFKYLPVVRTIAWSAFNQTVYPSGFEHPDITIPRPDITYLKMQGGEEVIPTYLPAALQLHAKTIKPLFYPIGQDNLYILSKAFYDNDMEQCSVLEWALLTMLKGHALSAILVSALGSEVRKLPPMAQSYYIPIILTMIHYCRRGD